MTKKSNTNINLGGSSIFICLLILKLTETIDWSWWWVTAPLWIPFAIFGVILGLTLIVGLIGAMLK